MAKTKEAPPSGTYQVVNSAAKLRTFSGVQIGPGVSAISAEDGEKILAHPHFLKLKAAGKMSISKTAPATKGKDVAEAKELVAQTHDKKLLDTYGAEDQRPEVTEAIREKHKELDKKPDADDKD